MTVERIRSLYQQRPFQPFIIHLADGRQLTVHHNEFLSFFPSGRTIILTQPDDSFNMVDLLLVTDLEVKAPASPQLQSS